MPRFDIITFGETMIRLSPPRHETLEYASSLDLRIGGSESNTAAALKCLGRSVSWWSKLPNNPLGKRLEADIRRRGVDTSSVIWSDKGRAGVYFIEFGAPPRSHHVTYDRADSAVSTLAADEVDWSSLERGRHLHVTGITPALSPTCAQTVQRAVEEAKSRKLTVSLDVNFRAKLWSTAQARETLTGLLPFVDLLICPAGDASDVFEVHGEGFKQAQTLRSITSISSVVVTAGDDGVFAVTDSGEFFYPVICSVEVDRVGAGDAYDAGLLDGFLDGDIARGMRFGAAMAALKRTMPGDELFASREEIEALASGMIDARGIRR